MPQFPLQTSDIFGCNFLWCPKLLLDMTPFFTGCFQNTGGGGCNGWGGGGGVQWLGRGGECNDWGGGGSARGGGGGGSAMAGEGGGGGVQWLGRGGFFLGCEWQLSKQWILPLGQQKANFPYFPSRWIRCWVLFLFVHWLYTFLVASYWHQ